MLLSSLTLLADAALSAAHTPEQHLATYDAIAHTFSVAAVHETDKRLRAEIETRGRSALQLAKLLRATEKSQLEFHTLLREAAPGKGAAR